MKVWILYQNYAYETTDVIEIFSTKEKAADYYEKLNNVSNLPLYTDPDHIKDCWKQDCFFIEEWEVE